MHRQKVLIADRSEDYCCLLTDILKTKYQTRYGCTGPEVLRLLEEFSPDVLLLDVNMPVIDGISILRDYDICRPSTVFAMIANGSDFALSLLTSLGVDFVMIKPCNVSILLSRLTEYSQMCRQPTPMHPAAPSRISAMLQRFGFAPGQNLEYIRTALPYLVCDPLQRLSKELYPSVAAIYNCSSWWQVERGIRLAIQDAHEQGDPQVWRRYFPKTEGCPTNKEFLLTVAELLVQEGEAEIAQWRVENAAEQE